MKAILAGSLFIGPAGGKLLSAFNALVDDGFVTHYGSNHFVVPLNERCDESGQLTSGDYAQPFLRYHHGFLS